jgi:eukaryotic-like serine/threonine-protein kinase
VTEAPLSAADAANLEALVYDRTVSPDATLNPLSMTWAQAPSEGAQALLQGPMQPLKTLEVEALPLLSVQEDGQTEDRCDLQVNGLLGEGGMGVVQQARQVSLQREVAVKRLKGGADAGGAERARSSAPEMMRALLDEAMLMGALEHPNIVPVHALGRTTERGPLLVMKKVEGHSWRALLRDPGHRFWMEQGRGSDRLGQHLSILMQVCNAAHFAHSRGVIHRDIKPENVMVGSYGEVYLMDWGIALRVGDGVRGGDGKLRGTPAYMAPEMLKEEAGQGARTDVYLLGATLHEVLVGRPRHEGGSVMAALMSVVASAPYAYGADVPAELGELCNSACHVDPSQRPQSAAAMREQVAAFLQHRGAARLAAEAASRVEELRALLGVHAQARAVGHGLKVYQAFNEARFALRQSLRDWPEQPDGAALLRSLLTLMIGHELEQRNADLAASLLSELSERGDERQDLAARLVALRAELRDEDGARQRLARLEHDQDMRVGSAQRASLLRLVIMAPLVGVPLTVVLFSFGVHPWSTRGSLVIGGVIFGLIMIFVLRWRAALLSNAFNRNISALLLTGFAGMLSNRALGVFFDDPLPHVAARDLLILALISTLGGVVIGRRVWGAVPSFVVALLLGLLFPERALPISLGGVVVSVLVLAWLERRALAALSSGEGVKEG